MNREHFAKPAGDLQRKAEGHTASQHVVVHRSATNFINEPTRKPASPSMHGDLATSATPRFQIPDTRIDELIQLWRDAYGEELSRATARQRVADLLDLYRVLMRRPPHSSETLPEASAANADG
jgi:rRNA-processing protein FCF1